MKKIKYLLFIIPLFFIFFDSSKAFNIITCGDSSVTEQTIINIVNENFSNPDLTDYQYLFCYRRFGSTLECQLRKDDPNTRIVANGTASSRYLFKYKYLSPYYKITMTNCTDNIQTYYVTSTSSDVFVYSYPYVENKTFFYSNFDSTVINNTVSSSDFYTYNLLSIEEPDPEPETPIIENKIYLPDELQEGNCPVILNKDTIRVYEEQPTINTLVSYTDYFINSHYIKQTGDDMPTDTITCLDLDNFTTSYVYRFDFDKIIVIFVSILFLIAYPVMKIIHAFFVGFKRR